MLSGPSCVREVCTEDRLDLDEPPHLVWKHIIEELKLADGMECLRFRAALVFPRQRLPLGDGHRQLGDLLAHPLLGAHQPEDDGRGCGVVARINAPIEVPLQAPPKEAPKPGPSGLTSGPTSGRSAALPSPSTTEVRAEGRGFVISL